MPDPSPAAVTPPPRYVARAEREAFGRSLRDRAGRSEQRAWVENDRSRDPLARVVASEAGRLTDRLAFRHGRMAVSPFAFLRGAAWVMAPDLASLPSTGYVVQICGDAHVRNLGAYATPDGHIAFDVNDFDETCRAPWEWDLKRLAISLVLAAREANASERAARDAVVQMVQSWRETLRDLSELPVTELARYAVHRFGLDGAIARVLHKAERMSPLHARDELTELSGDRHQFLDARPKLARLPEAEAAKVLSSLLTYRDTLGPNRQQVVDSYLAYDVAFKLAGTGSVGAHNYAVLAMGNGADDALILQVKEALPSCYHALGLVGDDPRVSAHHGKRVAEGQHRMQTWVDPFLGWTTIDDAPYYVRQLADHKAAIDPADLRREALVEYARVCGETFAKAHARTGDPAVLWGYAGKADKLDRAFGELAKEGADQVTKDWEKLTAAIARGELTAVVA